MSNKRDRLQTDQNHKRSPLQNTLIFSLVSLIFLGPLILFNLSSIIRLFGHKVPVTTQGAEPIKLSNHESLKDGDPANIPPPAYEPPNSLSISITPFSSEDNASTHIITTPLP